MKPPVPVKLQKCKEIQGKPITIHFLQNGPTLAPGGRGYLYIGNNDGGGGGQCFQRQRVNVLLSFPPAHPHHKRHDAATLAMFCTSHAVERKPVRNTSWQQLSRQASWQQLSRQASWQELSAQASWQHLSRQAPWQQLSRQASWQQLSRHGAATLAMFCTSHAVN